MIDRVICFIAAGISGIGALFFTFLVFATNSAINFQCPDGSDCEDATFAFKLFGILDVFCLAIFLPSLWFIPKKATKKKS